MKVFARVIPLIGFGVLITGCGGGGSSSTNNALPGTSGGHCATAAGSPGSSTGSVIASCAVGSALNSTLTVDSNPSGLTVNLNGASIGSTKLTSTPPLSATVYTYAILPNNGNAPFTYQFEQTENGNHTIFYNQAADTSGSITTIATSSVARLSLQESSSLGRSGVRRFMSSLTNRPIFDTTRLIVSYNASVLQSQRRSVSDIETGFGLQDGVTLGPVQHGAITRVFNVSPGQDAYALADKFKADSAVSAVEMPRKRFLLSSPQVTPNDPLFNNSSQWDMFRINALNAWGYSSGSPSIAVAVIDTGIDANQGDFSGSKITYAEKVLNGKVTFGTVAVQDLDGHGTNVAGLAAASTNNSFGFAGVGFSTSLQVYRIFPDPVNPNYSGDPSYGTTTADEAQAIYDAVARGAKVINLSLGAPAVDSSGNSGFDPVERDAVEYAISQGVTVVAAAGNEGSSTLDFPAAYDGVISVGASGLNDGNSNPNVGAPPYSTSFPDTVASYSNYGPSLSVLAPGGDPSSSADMDSLHWIINDYSTMVADPSQRCSSTPCRVEIAGTSQATPHVVGAAALLLSVNPNLTPAQIASLLESTADDIHDSRQGHGRINLYRALAALKGDSAPSQPTNANFVAIAYVPNGTNKPNIIETTFLNGVPVASDGTFRLADIPTNAAAYKIGVWYDANGNGLVDAGDWFGSTVSTCSPSVSCTSAATGITVHPVSSGFVLN